MPVNRVLLANIRPRWAQIASLHARIVVLASTLRPRETTTSLIAPYALVASTVKTLEHRLTTRNTPLLADVERRLADVQKSYVGVRHSSELHLHLDFEE